VTNSLAAEGEIMDKLKDALVKGRTATNLSLSAYEIITNAVNDDGSISLSTDIPATIISPLIDADAQDLSDSTRSQTEFAMALSFALRYAGLNTQANAFEQFVKNTQFDIRTRNQSVAVNAFSGADGKFGFQIGPRLKALGNPAKSTSGPDQILDRQSFPALLILHLGAIDLRPKIRLYPADYSHPIPTLEQLTNDWVQVKVMEPLIKFTEIQRWTPMKHFLYRDGWLFQLFQPTEMLNRPLTERKRLLAVLDLNQAREAITNGNFNVTSKVRNALLKRIENLESQLAGADGSVLLDANDVVPQASVTVSTNKASVLAITGSYPSQFVVQSNSTSFQQFVFLGSGLEQVYIKGPETNVSILPATMTNYVTVTGLDRVGQALILTVSINFTNFQTSVGDKTVLFKFSAATNTSTSIAASVLSMPVVLSHVAKAEEQSPTLVFSNSGSSSTGGFTYTVVGPTNAIDATNVLNLAGLLIKSDLEKNKLETSSSSNTVLNISIKSGLLDTNGTIKLKL
jgi:hypothetical protein